MEVDRKMKSLTYVSIQNGVPRISQQLINLPRLELEIEKQAIEIEDKVASVESIKTEIANTKFIGSEFETEEGITFEMHKECELFCEEDERYYLTLYCSMSCPHRYQCDSYNPENKDFFKIPKTIEPNVNMFWSLEWYGLV